MLFMDVTCTSSKYETRSGGPIVDEFADAEPGACLLNGEHGRSLRIIALRAEAQSKVRDLDV